MTDDRDDIIGSGEDDENIDERILHEEEGKDAPKEPPPTEMIPKKIEIGAYIAKGKDHSRNR